MVMKDSNALEKEMEQKNQKAYKAME